MQRLIVTMLCLLIASPVWAFPTTPVLDTFTGVDGTEPPNSNWTNDVIRNVAGGCQLQDNAVAGNSLNALRGCYWNVTTFGANCEAYVTIVNTGSTVSGGVMCRLANIGNNTTDGYAVDWVDAASEIHIFRIDNDTTSQLGDTISQAIATGDKIGISTIGDQICAWFDDGGAGWTQLACRTDSTYTAGGYIGMDVQGSTTVGAMDDFGGGTAIIARPVAPILFQ